MKIESNQEVKQLLEELTTLYEEVVRDGDQYYANWEESIQKENFKASAKNLSYYLALRSHDIRKLQEQLVTLGLSSLGRLESKTLSTLEAVIANLTLRTDRKSEVAFPSKESFLAGEERLRINNEHILGEEPEERHTRIMVTLPTEAATNPTYVENLISAGMNVARINCAHDSEEIWQDMIHNIQAASEKLQKAVKIMLDIAGPKIRTDWVYTTHKNPKVEVGDQILFTRNYKDLPIDSSAKVIAGFNVDEIYQAIQTGDPILIDDGSIESETIEVTDHNILVNVTKVKGKSIRLKSEKGLNFPKTAFEISILSAKDREDLKFASQHADIIACSFVRNGDDISEIQKALHNDLGDKANDIALLAKIETVQAIENLPEIIMTASSENPFSVMIARGDLAVESGYIRLTELQQEILWICEAADIPVVWGTEVLATLIGKGIPTRSELTDAAEGAKADCVMLNKGEHIEAAIEMLDQILITMQEHVYKKTSKLRALSIAKMKNK